MVKPQRKQTEHSPLCIQVRRTSSSSLCSHTGKALYAGERNTVIRHSVSEISRDSVEHNINAPTSSAISSKVLASPLCFGLLEPQVEMIIVAVLFVLSYLYVVLFIELLVALAFSPIREFGIINCFSL